MFLLKTAFIKIKFKIKIKIKYFLKQLHFILFLRSLVLTTGLILTTSLTSCFEAGSLDLSIQGQGIAQLKQLSVVYYDAVNAKVFVSGLLNNSSVTLLNTVQFYSNAQCSGSDVGHGTYQDFKSGLELTVSSQQPSGIYIKTNTLAYCMYLTDFSAQFKIPSPPQFLNFNPASPSHDTTTPLIKGAVTVRNYRIDFFDDTQCTHGVGSGSADLFTTNGVALSLTSNQTSAIYAKAVDAFDQKSDCTLMASFVHSVLGPANPTFVTTDPLTPSRLTSAPLVKGTASVDTQSVSIYSDSGCVTKIGEGLKADFISTGVSISANENAITYIYAKAFDSAGRPSSCAYLSSFVHDNVAPVTGPQFMSSTPPSPTRLTTYPKLKGLVGSSDTATVVFYNSPVCLLPIGSGTKAAFESSGVLAGVLPNAITNIYAVNVDASGNRSPCIYLTSFKHNTIAPDSAVFSSSTPISPNNITASPKIFGNASATTVSVTIYDNDICTHAVGSGQGATFDSAGINVVLTPNVISTLYSRSTDAEGNISACNFLTNYAHSNVPSPVASFVSSSPASPSKVSTTPYMIGSAPTSVSSVQLFNDNQCANLIGQSSRLTFTTSGIRATASANAVTTVYSKTVDVYGNMSPCTYLTDYTHCNVAPSAPVFTSITPASPNRTSITPTVVGLANQNLASILPPTQISLYDSFLCLNQLATGSKATFTSTGLSPVVYANAESLIYARAFDAAGNFSGCQLMTNYINDSTKPGNPSFVSALPKSPSYTEFTVIKGAVANVSKVLPVSAVNLYSDAVCTNLLSTGSKDSFITSGLPLTANLNATTLIYGQTADVVGNQSTCMLLYSFTHSNLGPAGLTLQQNLNGSVNVTWAPDASASPTPTYVVKRSLYSGGPYSVLVANNAGNSFVDNSVNLNTTYYYVVASTNPTGTSANSTEQQITITSGAPNQAISLLATSGPGQIDLQWSGFASDMNFQIYRSQNSGGPYTEVAAKIFSTTYSDKTVVNGQAYYYVVIGVNPFGESLTSLEASAQALDVPSAPINLKINLVDSTPDCGGGHGAYLSWSAPSYYTNFSLNRSTSAGSTSFYTSVVGNSTVDCSFPLSNIFYNVYYTVQADWGLLKSAISNEVSFKDYTAVSLQVFPGNNEIYLNWTGIPQALSYTLYKSQMAQGPFTVVASGLTGASYYDAAVVNNQPYFYYVKTIFSSGENWPSLTQSGVPGALPNNPSHLVLSTDSVGLPILNWTASNKYNYFNIYKSNNFAGPYLYLAQSLTTTFQDSVPDPGMNYYKVTAVWGGYETAMTNFVAYRSGIPTGLTISSNSNSITVSWGAVPSATSYNIYRSPTSGSGYTLITAAATSPYVDSSVVVDTGYYYVVSANFADATTGPLSNEVTAMTTTSNVPSGLTITNTTTSSISLAWTPIPNSTSYKVYYSTSVGGPYVSAGAAVLSNAFQMNSLTLGTEYFFKVTSKVSGTESALSNFISAKTFAPPSAPGVTPGQNNIDLQWTSAVGATSYTVQRTTDGVTFTTLATGVPATSYSDASAVNGTLYFYRIMADYSIQTLFSVLSVGVTAGIAPEVPTGLTVIDNSTGTDLTFSWAKASSATTYKLYQATASGGPYSVVLNTASLTQNVVSGLTVDTSYFYVLTALNGSLESAISAELKVTTTVTPPAPLAKATAPTQIDLSWSAVAGAATYIIYRSTDGFTFDLLASSVAALTYSDATAVSSNTYQYKYLPVSAAGSALALSAPSSWTTTTIAPLSPVSLRAQSTGLTTVDLSWVNSPNANVILIYRGVSAGGPYSLINSISGTLASYTDTTVVAGTTYYYVVRSQNTSSVESVNSNEVAIQLVAGPANLVSALSPNKIQLTWNAVASATGYTVRRGLQAGGPYGVLAQGLVALNFDDLNIQNGIQYFYVVDAEFASGAISVHSNETNIMSVNNINLQIPIELLDRGVLSQTSTVNFLRTKTSFDTGFYDGSVTFSWQIVAENYSTVASSVQLINQANQVVGVILVPASTSVPTLFSGIFTPTMGADIYQLQLPATANIGDVQVHSARLLISQTQATKTRIYIPLAASYLNATDSDTDGFVEETAATTFQELASSSVYRRDTAALSQLANYNAWELETIVSSTATAQGPAQGSVALINQTQGRVISRTQGIFNSTTPQLIRSPFDEGVADFDASNEMNVYQVTLRCEVNCSQGKVRLHKAGLWVTLESLTKAEVFFRTTLGSQLMSPTIDTSERSFLISNLFTNPVAYFQAVGSTTGVSGGQTTLLTSGALDGGTAGAVALSPTLNINTLGKGLFRSSSFVLPANDKLITDISPSADPLKIVDTMLVIRVSQ